MTTSELFEVAGYFANPIRNTRIEIEARQRTLDNYAPAYQAQTGSPLPTGSDAVYALPNNADKWGREMRLYFTCADAGTVPVVVAQKMTVGGRPGYDQWNQRLNSKDIIDVLFECGFTLGEPQKSAAIRTNVPPANTVDFDRGYNAP